MPISFVLNKLLLKLEIISQLARPHFSFKKCLTLLIISFCSEFFPKHLVNKKEHKNAFVPLNYSSTTVTQIKISNRRTTKILQQFLIYYKWIETVLATLP